MSKRLIEELFIFCLTKQVLLVRIHIDSLNTLKGRSSSRVKFRESSRVVEGAAWPVCEYIPE